MKHFNVLVTGSSGYVASNLIPLVKEIATVFGVDKDFSQYTNIHNSVESPEFVHSLKQLPCNDLMIVNLAAARFDFGATARDYYRLNVDCHEKFLSALININVTKFIHVSSVAAFDGRNIDYTDNLNCDDAYRATKYLQEAMITKWCDERGVPLTILYPSAIFSDDPRSDTNIGKLQLIAKKIPLIPRIEVTKSLTYLPFFSKFIVSLVAGEIPHGKYLTIEKPTLTVSRMIQLISQRPVKLVNFPAFRVILEYLANILYVLGFFGRFDLKLTPNRVVKVFSDTSYSHISSEAVDTETYNSCSCEELPEILVKLTKGERNG